METSSDDSSGEAPRMTTTSRHYFGGDSSQLDHHFSVDIIENVEEEYGMFVWPCSIVLSEYVWQQRFRFQGISVLELGAGTSLPGIVAAKVGSDVILTDKSDNSEILSNMRSICDQNEVNCQILGLNWGEWDSNIFDLHPKIILGADVLYDTAAKKELDHNQAYLRA
ncbi:methyltransferase-like protein 23 isoform X2 [Carex littledalei]|uniref:Methyltransferase-like protein 23 isoform X2 n=1 Tax=Carex littledalei TaxID=544730 RepID=A0A833RHR2_9POAL|nr:methyltransferase-like protein 23 isoform X2 [Carex littledalei]